MNAKELFKAATEKTDRGVRRSNCGRPRPPGSAKFGQAAASARAGRHRPTRAGCAVDYREVDAGDTPIDVAVRHGHGDQAPGPLAGWPGAPQPPGPNAAHVAAAHGHPDQIVGYLTAEVLAMKDTLNVTALDLAQDSGCLAQLPPELVELARRYIGKQGNAQK